MLTMLDENFSIVGVIDDYYSMVWTERYLKIGEYEASIPDSERYSSMLDSSVFLLSSISDSLMVLGDIYYTYDSETGASITLKGNSIEDVLRWRSTLESKEYLLVNVRDTIISLIDTHMVSPSVGDRAFPSFIVDPTLAANADFDALTYSGNFDATSVYNIVEAMCLEHDLGYEVRFDKVSKQLIFNLVLGADRSHQQTSNPYVVFSSDIYNNVLNSEYFISGAEHRNVAACNYEPDDPGVNSYWSIPPAQRTDGYFRREETLITDLVVQSPPGTILPGESTSFLKERRKISIFDGDLDLSGPFRYKVDFFLGDIVQCIFSNKSTTARLVEVIYSSDPDGEKTSASFDFE